jgi:branched-subunit amino acid ABC-type transport system permease component
VYGVLHLLWESTFYGLVTAGIIALGAVGVTLQFGISNIMNLAFGATMTLSAFLAYSLSAFAHLNFWFSALVAALLSGVFSVVMNRYLLQPFMRKGSSLFTMLMVTFAAGIILENAIMAVWGAQYFSLTLPGQHVYQFIGWSINSIQIIIFAVSIVGMVLVHLLLTYTDIGKAMRAMSDDVSLAQLAGVKVRRISDLTWFVSGILGGLGGLILAVNTASFDHSTGSLFLMTVLAAALLGGIGRPYGAMFGAVVIGVATEWFSALVGGQYSFAVALAALVLVLLYRPNGILAGSGG